MVSAAEIGQFVYCAEAWRLEAGFGLEPGNRASRAAGTRQHGRKALVERFAGGAISLGRVLIVLAMLGLVLLWVVTR